MLGGESIRMARQKFDYYDIKRLFKSYPNAHYYLVFGERSNGKTYSALSYAIERYVKNREQFAYIRRWGEDIRKKNLSDLFKGHIENGFISEATSLEFNSIDYSSSKFYLENVKDESDKRSREISEDPCGYAFDINSMEHYKSISFPRITTIIFDEFMSRQGYLPNEWVLFTNAISTIVRLRDNVKIIMLGNTVNKYCPYFEEMGLKHIKDQKPGTIDEYHYGDSDLTVVCEYTGSSAKRGGKPSDVYFAFDNPELRMITSGEWEIAVYPHLDIKLRPKDVVYEFFVMFGGETLHGNVVSLPNGVFIYFHRKTTPIKDEDNDIVYTDKPSEKWNYRMCLTKHSDKLSRFIIKCLRENKIFYSTNEVGEVFRNYVMWSDSFSIKN